VIKSTAALSAAVALALGLTLAGCTTPASVRGTQDVAGVATSVVETTVTTANAAPGTPSPGGSSISSQADAEAIDKQLDAMQKELDSLSMPTDSDFGTAESALY
jgi:hypothetical protein